MKGFKHSKETKNFISKSKYKCITQLDLQGKFIKEWDSATTAAKELGLYSQNISHCCNGKLGSTGKFKWEFKD